MDINFIKSLVKQGEAPENIIIGIYHMISKYIAEECLKILDLDPADAFEHASSASTSEVESFLEKCESELGCKLDYDELVTSTYANGTLAMLMVMDAENTEAYVLFCMAHITMAELVLSQIPLEEFVVRATMIANNIRRYISSHKLTEELTTMLSNVVEHMESMK